MTEETLSQTTGTEATGPRPGQRTKTGLMNYIIVNLGFAQSDSYSVTKIARELIDGRFASDFPDTDKRGLMRYVNPLKANPGRLLEALARKGYEPFNEEDYTPLSDGLAKHLADPDDISPARDKINKESRNPKSKKGLGFIKRRGHVRYVINDQEAEFIAYLARHYNIRASQENKGASQIDPYHGKGAGKSRFIEPYQREVPVAAEVLKPKQVTSRELKAALGRLEKRLGEERGDCSVPPSQLRDYGLGPREIGTLRMPQASYGKSGYGYSGKEVIGVLRAMVESKAPQEGTAKTAQGV